MSNVLIRFLLTQKEDFYNLAIECHTDDNCLFYSEDIKDNFILYTTNFLDFFANLFDTLNIYMEGFISIRNSEFLIPFIEIFNRAGILPEVEVRA